MIDCVNYAKLNQSIHNKMINERRLENKKLMGHYTMINSMMI